MSRQLRSFYLMRHAEVETAYHQTFGGRIDMELSKRGQVQARSLAEFLRRRSLDSCFSSPMKRAVQTAAPCREWTKPILLNGLREVDFGDWTGLRWEEVREKYGKSARDWLHLLEANAIPKAEAIEQFRARIQEIWNILRRPENGNRIGVFGHGGVIRMLLALLLQMPARQMAAFEFCYASVTILRIRENRPEVQLLNYCPWRASAQNP